MNFKLLLMLLAVSPAAMAQQISTTEAAQRARAFLRGNQSTPKMRKAASATGAQLTLAYTAHEGDENQFYVFNNGTDGGYIIIGADERANEILGYGESASFDYESIPDNMKWWLSQYQAQIHSAIANDMQVDETTSEAAPRRAPANRSNISPLIKTKWGQGSPYNASIPAIDGTPAVTGCVATAAAQIMKYWQHPTVGNNYHSFSYKPQEASRSYTYSANFGNTEYDWTNMTNTYSSSSTAAQKKAVSTLMYHIGVGSEIKYGTNGSSGNTINLVNALYSYFRYPTSIAINHREYFTDEEWETLVYNELAANRPVFYAGNTPTTPSSGHAFVCHGYRASDNTFAINWGWNGDHDGYFPLTGTKALTPNGTGIGGGAAGSSYTSNQEVLTGFTSQQMRNVHHLTLGALDYRGILLSTYKYSGNNYTQTTPATSLTVQQGSMVLTDNMFLSSSSALGMTPYILALACEDSKGNIYYAEKSGTPQSINAGSYFSALGFDLPSTMPNGTYSVSLAYKAEGNKMWTKVHQVQGLKMPTITIKNSAVSASAQCTSFKLTSSSTAAYSSPCKVTMSFKTTSAHTTDKLIVGLKFSHGEHEYYASSFYTYTISAGAGRVSGDQALSFALNNNIHYNGNYTVVPVCRKDNNSPWVEMPMSGIKPLSVTITGLPFDVCDYTLGDINNDKKMNISDVTALVNIILGKSPTGLAADVNEDSKIDISDVTTLVNQILGK